MELRIRVLRIMNGEFHSDDLNRVLLWLRDRSYGAWIVRELGDFIAHSDTRTKGPLTEELRQSFRTIRFHVRHTGQPFTRRKLPPDTPGVARFTFGRLDRHTIRAETGLAQRSALRILESVLSLLVPTTDGYYAIPRPLTPQEDSVLACALNNLSFKHAFTSDALWTQFRYSLGKNHLLSTNEVVNIGLAKAALTLRTIETMHLTDVVLEDGWTASLTGGLNYDKLVVSAVAGMTKPDGIDFKLAYPIFLSDLVAEQWCDPPLTTDVLWQQPVEMIKGPKLTPLRP